MNRHLTLLGICLLLSLPMLSCNSGGVVLYAQSLPASLHGQWNPNPPAENVVDYQLRLDGGAPVTIPLSVCTATLCRTAFTVPTWGAHTVTYSARNLKLASDPTSFQEGPQTMPVAFTINQAPVAAPASPAVTQ